ncbi:Gfo/Idh/MocA family protein [Jiangella muralis]|uniref:Gfo/Idh/MocA family protein n=1 Tax=Jiangella muralis TaxID=702383 RepID=UPI0009FAE02B|nr:Gfo/Idh/MocA family oxidoreductase [Jiangella muralis]
MTDTPDRPRGRPVTAVVLSAGAWSQTAHLPALTSDPEVELLAVTSPRQATAERLAAEFGARHALADWRDALGLRPDITVVSSPPIAHVDQVTAALSAGSHVLVEKPFALGSADAELMCAAAESSGRRLLVGYGWSATPVFRHARACVESGRLGPLEQLTMQLAVNTRALLRGGSDGGWAGAGASEPSTYTDPAVSGGGSAAVSMSHQLGLACWITGQRIARLAAFTTPSRSRTDLHTSVAVEFADSGAGVLSAASTQPFPQPPQWRLSLYGRDGQLDVETSRDAARWISDRGVATDLPPEVADGRYDAGAPTKALIRCARGEPPPEGMTHQLARHVVAVTDGIYESALTGTAVEIRG